MAKQQIISALEEVVGEYVLNVDKENLKIAALRGKLKLENVQLDGDLIGGHVLGAVGLSGFGVLSCHANTIKVSVPLKSLEKEPTRVEIKGIHLICLPLLPSTARKMYGAGTVADPRCTLRARAKRSKLARFEGNYMAGRIPGEGPPAKRILRAVKEVERKQQKRAHRRRGSSGKFTVDDASSTNVVDSEFGSFGDTDSVTDSSISKMNEVSGDIPELPRDWKVKLREKVMRNLSVSMLDIHIRCEVSEGGLDFCHSPSDRHRSEGTASTALEANRRAFSFGLTLESFTVRTADEKWIEGSHDRTTSIKDNSYLGPNEYDARNNKVISLENLCFYWNDDPPFLLSESDILTTPDPKMSTDKFLSRVAVCMEALHKEQEPGEKIRSSLSSHTPSDSMSFESRPHQYCLEGCSLQIRMKTSNRTEPGPISCLAELLPLQLQLDVRPFQFVQYQKLKSAMLSQRRFDTMLRQRPDERPDKDPKGWWKYAFECVTTRPTARPWIDVVKICKSRNTYIELVVKKMSKASSQGSGFHAGLSALESSTLLQIEELLPIEALLAFHLAALRKFTSAKEETQTKVTPQDIKSGQNASSNRSKSVSRTLTRMFKGSSKQKQTPSPEPQRKVDNALLDPPSSVPQSASPSKSMSLMEAMTLRLGNKKWFVHFKLDHVELNLTLFSALDVPIIKLEAESGGAMRTFGRGKIDFHLDVTKFEVVNGRTSGYSGLETDEKILVLQAPEDDCNSGYSQSSAESSLFNFSSVSGFMNLPQIGVVCRLAAAKDPLSNMLSFSSHPATLVWTRPCFDALAEFFGAPSGDTQVDLASHLKNAATPLARKAQLALNSPSIFMIHINMAAPKVWLPISSKETSGALFLDAGNFRLACSKGDGLAQMNWDVDASDIQVNFARSRRNRKKDRSSFSSQMVDQLKPSRETGMSSILRPFHVRVVSDVQEWNRDTDGPAENPISYKGPVSCIDVNVSPISINFVDAEVLARAIGKWYAQSLVSIRGRASSRKNTPSKRFSERLEEERREEGAAFDTQQSTIPQSLSITLEKVEMALEGHSKIAQGNDDHSIGSHDTSVLESAWPTRTYVVEVFRIVARRSKHSNITATKLVVLDASVIQLKDASLYTPMKERHQTNESQYGVLERESQVGATPRHSPLRSPKTEESRVRRPEILRASFFHDGAAHLDEMEIDVDSIILRVTPTSLKDCMKGIGKVAELLQIMTREMERRVHDEGRKAWKKGRTKNDRSVGEQSDGMRPVSPAFSITSDLTDLPTHENKKSPTDSSLLFKMILNNVTVLAGRPTTAKGNLRGRVSKSRRNISFAVVQVSSNALVMFQSTEDFDGSGSKVLHVSLDDLSASVNTTFERVPTTQMPPMIGPTAAEVRVVYTTENLGCVVSHDISMDCEHLKSSLTPNDMNMLISITQKMLDRLSGMHDIPVTGKDKTSQLAVIRTKKPKPSIIRYKRSGAGVATTIRVEIHSFSFVILRAFQSKYGAPEFLSFNLKDLKASLGGCMSALSGDCSADISVDFYNSEVSSWEHCIEPCNVLVSVDQMPNELVLDFSTLDSIQINVTGMFLRDFAELDFDILKNRNDSDQSGIFSPSALSTIGLRRATEAHSVSIYNNSGLDINVDLSDRDQQTSFKGGVRFDSIGPGPIKSNHYAFLDLAFENDTLKGNKIINDLSSRLCLSLGPTAINIVGEREPIVDLPITSSSGSSAILRTLRPIASTDNGWRRPSANGRASPESSSLISENSRLDHAYYHAEPVVEWCMQLSRLRSNVSDLYSLEKGRDLLSTNVWSPEEEYSDYSGDYRPHQGHGSSEQNPTSPPKGGKNRTTRTPDRKGSASSGHESNWVRPYLKGDSPEWTDMTCILRMARERVMLPDNNWLWVNDWTVDISGDLGQSIDADGWEYQADFETFERSKRFYAWGDSCRRRRWTRTRIVRPPRLDDSNRLLKFVWETSRDESGNFKIEVKSHVTIHNRMSAPFSIFVASPSWDSEQLVGSIQPEDKAAVPVPLATAVYMRLAKSRTALPSSSLEDYVVSDRLVILPLSYNSSTFVRSSIKLNDVSETRLHFLIKLVCRKGIIDLYIEPVLRIVNLLPCQLECQLGEVLRPADSRPNDIRPNIAGIKNKRIANVETLKISSGKEGMSAVVNPESKPHISLRVPGYKWSAWQKIINRKADSYTWRPSQSEEDWYLTPDKSDDYADEFKSIVRFDRTDKTSDSLFLIVSVECGHSPRLRVYAQYWIMDKTGFGCRFCEGFTDILGTAPDKEFSRRSHLPKSAMKDPIIHKDIGLPGHQWSIGMSGMSLYYSAREKISVSIEVGSTGGNNSKNSLRSKWVSPIDISNVMPKTVFHVDELGGRRRFELALSVTTCPGNFGRTKLINLIPRYQIVNLLKRQLIVAQDGCLNSETLIPSQSSVVFHWDRQSLPPKVRLGAPSLEEKDSGDYNHCWTNGCIQLDKVGITSMRLPTSTLIPTKPMAVQAEVRLATKDQDAAVMIVIWSANEQSNPLYLLKNKTSHTIICRQPLQDEPINLDESRDGVRLTEGFSENAVAEEKKSAIRSNSGYECGTDFSPVVRSILGLDRIEEFVWVLRSGDVACFGFDDPEKPHILEWSYARGKSLDFDEEGKTSFLEVDAMGSASRLVMTDTKEIVCQIGAEHSTKVIEFSENLRGRYRRASMMTSSKKNNILHEAMAQKTRGQQYYDDVADDDDENVAIGLRFHIPTLAISVIDNADPSSHGKEVLLAQFDGLYLSASQSREGYHEFEMRLMTMQCDNHVSSIHPVLIFCPRMDENEPFLHLSAVRRLQQSSTFVFRYAAFRVLDINIFLDRETAETMARFIEPLRATEETASDEAMKWLQSITDNMDHKFSKPDRRTPRDIEKIVLAANSGRIYFEQLHLHPVRLAFTFTQEWTTPSPDDELESTMVLQFIRGMASIADAPLTFTSFVVSHVFESPHAFLRVIAAHYSSQLTKQIFGIVGSLAILGAPADFISNVGTGVRDFFYEPIQGAVHGPRQFIEGLEAGTQSLARGVFVGVVRGAANVTEAVNVNLAGLTADDDFIDERKAHQRMLTDAMSRTGVMSRTFGDSLFLAGASVARGVRSGVVGLVDHPTRYSAKYGPVGLVKGVGKGLIGAVLKPVVGVGDAAALLMNHAAAATSKQRVLLKIPKRLRRALPSRSVDKPHCVALLPYDDRAAKAQKIVTGGESVSDVYIGHVNIPSHLIIASDQCLWAIDRRSREPWCVSWEEISHFCSTEGGMQIVVFSQFGMKPYLFQVDSSQELIDLQALLNMQAKKMGNAKSSLADLGNFKGGGGLDISQHFIPGIKSKQVSHVFGACNQTKTRLASAVKDEILLIEQLANRLRRMNSESPTYFEILDEEAWTLVSSWGQVFSGLSSRRCIVTGIINGTGVDIQIKSTKLVEGGSPCYSIPTRDFDSEQGILHAGGAILIFGWGVVPSLLQAGNVFMNIETNSFVADLSVTKSRDTFADSSPGYSVGFLEKSYDNAGWWAKYWLLVLKS